MIPENKAKLFQFKELAAGGIKKLQPEVKNEKQIEEAKKSGETEIIPADIKEIMEKVHGSENSLTGSAAEIDSHLQEADGNIKTDETNKTGDEAKWDEDTNIRNFIITTLKEAGFDVENNPEVVDEIFVAIIKAMLEGKIDIQTNIASVTALIDINLRTEVSIDRAMMVTQLIDTLLNQGESVSKTTNGDVKELILKELQKIIDANKTDTVEPVDPDEPIVLTPTEKAMTELIAAIDNVQVDGNMSIKDFLLQFKTEASKYIQLQFGYGEQFADIIAMFLATAVSDTSGVSSGLMKNANLSAIKEKFLALVQDMSFLDTTNGLSGRTSSGQFDIMYIFPSQHRTENGYRVGYAEAGNHITDDSFMYNTDGTPNNANFLKFLVAEYLKNDVYGGLLNSTQMEAVMKAVITKFGEGGYTSTKPYGCINIHLYDEAVRDGINKNGNNTIFDELLSAMMYVVNNKIKPLNTDDLTDANTTTFINSLFGTKTSISAAQIYNSENAYLISNNRGVRGIIQALVDVSEQYNVHNAEDYKEFLNVFIKMIYEKCGEEVQFDSSGNPILTKDILSKYFEQGNTLQDLKNFAESKELRNRYYMEYILENGGINDTIEDFGQGRSGDCWLLSCLAALNASETGRNIIANAITDNGDGTYTVTFHGGWEQRTSSSGTKYWARCAVENSFTISIDEVMDRMGTGNYAFGDPTVVLLEIATSKLREKYEQLWGNGGDKWIYSGTQEEMLHYLIGPVQNTDIYVQQISSRPEYAQQQADKIKNWVLEQLANGNIEPGGVGNYMLTMSYGNHAYAVTGVTDKGIYYVDPYHPSVKKFITWAELAECKVKDSSGKYYTEYFIVFGYAELTTENN